MVGMLLQVLQLHHLHGEARYSRVDFRFLLVNLSHRLSRSLGRRQRNQVQSLRFDIKSQTLRYLLEISLLFRG